MKIFAVHPGANLPSARIRVVQLAPYLEQLGAKIECVEYPDRFSDRRQLTESMRSSDLVFVHYRLPTMLDAFLWRGFSAPIVFDFDDAILLRHKPKNGSYRSSTRKSRFERMLRLADAFSCGNRYLESLVAQTNKPTHITPSPVPLDVPVRDNAALGGSVRMGWIGGRGNLDSLEKLGPVLTRLAEERDIVLVVIADAAPRIEGVRVEEIAWTKESQERELARLDIGLMPIEDNPWNRGKCAYKLLQYMAAGVASVGSPVGMNAELIRNGENGLLATSEDEWFHALTTLVGDTKVRARLGRAGRETVERAYGYESVARGLAKFLEGVVAKHVNSARR
jgi:glycosyltransferase involved in cell wall biosynthesis